MNELGQEVAAAWGLTPKPRGEGAWAFVRYHLKRAVNRTDFGSCCVPGCPNALIIPIASRCPKHTDKHRAALDAEILEGIRRNRHPSLPPL